MKPTHRWIAVLLAAVLMAVACAGQAPSGKKTYTFRGKVEAVDEKARSLTIDGERVAGWMEAMTMDYKVDNPAILKTVKPGDQITATVYDDDLTLHQVKIVAAKPRK